MQTAIPKVARACLAAAVFGLPFATSVVAACEERDTVMHVVDTKISNVSDPVDHLGAEQTPKARSRT